uniref:Uncharacterized protein n=1 Tax=Romanomermis culicivorax TaxID=13658 RepID=A0A915I1Q7_ROMCU
MCNRGITANNTDGYGYNHKEQARLRLKPWHKIFTFSMLLSVEGQLILIRNGRFSAAIVDEELAPPLRLPTSPSPGILVIEYFHRNCPIISKVVDETL